MAVGACFGLATAATAWFIGGRLPFPSVPGISPRYRYLADRKDEFDTVFIGSSRIRHQVDPQQFDAETATQGAATHSFNLGYSGMWMPESYYYLRQILALHPRQLRWVVIELMDYRFGQVEGQPATARSVYWHDAKHTAMAWRLVAESAQSLPEKLSQLAGHARLFLERTANLGRGAEWLQERYYPGKQKSDMSWKQHGGFDPIAKSEWSEGARADYAQQIQRFEHAGSKGNVRPGFADALRDIVGEVRRAGAEPVFVIPPTVRVEEKLEEGLPGNVIVWAFDHPHEYPRLYQPELHCDPGHLNEAGAQEWTSLLAQRLAELARKR